MNYFCRKHIFLILLSVFSALSTIQISFAQEKGKDADWEYSATLAAAYAEVGDFELAVTEQRKVLDDKQIDATDKKEQEARLALYRAKKPYRDE